MKHLFRVVAQGVSVRCAAAICLYIWGISSLQLKVSTMILESDKVQQIWGIATDGRAAIEATRRGLPISTVDELVDSGRLSLAEIDRIVLPRKTLAHRREIGALTPDQSDRLMRVVRVVVAAENTFGSLE